MILSKQEILKALETRDIIADGINESQIAEHSIDCSLHNKIWLNKWSWQNTVIDLGTKLHIAEAMKQPEILEFFQPYKEKITRILTKVEQERNINGQDWLLIDISEGILFYPGLFFLPIVDEFVGARAGSGLNFSIYLKSTATRHGLDHALAGFAEEGYFNRLCLEMYSHIPVEVKGGDLVLQFVFHKLTSSGQDYASKKSYQKTSNLEELKASWRPEMVLPKPLKNKFDN